MGSMKFLLASENFLKYFLTHWLFKETWYLMACEIWAESYIYWSTGRENSGKSRNGIGCINCKQLYIFFLNNGENLSWVSPGNLKKVKIRFPANMKTPGCKMTQWMAMWGAVCVNSASTVLWGATGQSDMKPGMAAYWGNANRKGRTRSGSHCLFF